ncbi:MAG: DMT family transporter [Tumebacillaceae bacterium]
MKSNASLATDKASALSSLLKSGIMYAMLSSLVFSVMNALVKEVSVNVPSSEVAFFRGLIGTVIIFFMMRSAKVPFSNKGIPMLCLRGVLGALYLMAYFYTISKIPLTDASILAHMTPIFTFILAALLLKERVSRSTLYVLPIFIIGALLLVKPFNYTSYSIYALVGILSAVLAAAAGISIRILTKSHHTYEIVFYFLAIATVVAVPFMWSGFVIPSLTDSLYLLGIGVVSLVGQLVLTKAFSHENAVVVEIVRYIGIVYNAMWGFLFWAEVPDLLTITGGILVVGGCILLSRRKTA